MSDERTKVYSPLPAHDLDHAPVVDRSHDDTCHDDRTVAPRVEAAGTAEAAPDADTDADADADTGASHLQTAGMAGAERARSEAAPPSAGGDDTSDPRRLLAAAMRRSIVASSTRRPSLGISSGRAPGGVTPAPRPQLPIAGARAPFGITTSRRVPFPISSGRAPLGRVPSPATAPLDDADGSKESA